MMGLNLLIKSPPKTGHKLNSTMTRKNQLYIKKQQIRQGWSREPCMSTLDILSGREVKDVPIPHDQDALGKCQVPLC